ncbi:hypothetical protein [Pseudomonas serboccidentalis]|uniref:hypothetical protein n=1 Tax=Pseudomonas serboccidentalis TaxID=2964670 RepID=UPI0039DFBFB4
MNNESGVLTAFARNMEAMAQDQGALFSHYPTGGQDRNLLGDTIFTNSTMYSLVEFKDSIAKINSEKQKRTRVLAVCKAVFNKNPMQMLHDSCHFIAGDDPKTFEQVMFVYRHAVCNRQIFNKEIEKKLPFLTEKTDTTSKLFLNEYAKDIFSTTPRFALNVDDFGTYLEMLVNITTEGRKNTEICLIASSINEHKRCISVRFDNIAKLHEWTSENIYKQSPEKMPEKEPNSSQSLDDFSI